MAGTIRNPYSTSQQGLGSAIDVLAGSPQLRAKLVTIALPATTSNTTTYSNIHPLGIALTPLSGYIVFRTAPVMATGTATVTLTYRAADGSTATVLVATQTILLKTAYIPFALSLAAAVDPLVITNATNYLTMAAGGSLEVTVICSNNTVDTAQVGGVLVLVCDPVESSPITDYNLTVRGT